MLKNEDVVVSLLVGQLRKVPLDRLRALGREARDREIPAAQRFLEEKLLSADEVAGYREAARYLTAGDLVRACAHCLEQVVAPPAAKPCGRCGHEFVRGVLASPRSLRFDAVVERRVRRVILDEVARNRTEVQVAEANRARQEGKLAGRPEADLAPKDKSCGDTVLGPYALLGLVGRGSSSYVYRARDSRNGRILALKVLYFQEGDSAKAAQEKLLRFQREAQLASELDHPHLVSAGPLETAGPWHCIPMAFIDGPTMAQVLEIARQGGKDGDREFLARALCDVARGLHYAHCRGVVHRDVNPRNILFTGTGQALLGDFGIARPVEARSVLTGDRTLGALEYAAPERLRSEAHASACSDVYSLGVVLYEILSGRLPYAADNPMHLLPRIEMGPPPDPTAVRPGVSPAMAAVAMTALQRDPARRYPSALAFGEALSGCLEGKEPAPEPGTTGTAPAAARLPGTSRLRTAALVAVTFSLGALGTTWIAPGGDVVPAAEPWLERVRRDQARLEAAADRKSFVDARQALSRSLEEAERRLGREAETGLAHGRLAWFEGRLEDSARQFGRSLEDTRVVAEARRRHGLVCYFLSQRYAGSERGRNYRSQAERDYTAPLEGRTSDEPSFARSMLALMSGDTDPAYAGFHAVSRSSDADPESALMEAWTALSVGAFGVAVTTLEPVRGRTFDPCFHLAWAMCRLGEGKDDETVERLDEMSGLWPDLPEVPILRGMVALRRGDAEGALAAAAVAARLDSGVPQTSLLEASAHGLGGRPCESIGALTRALALEPESEIALYRRGQELLDHGSEGRGREDLRKYLELHPRGRFAERAQALIQPR